MRIAIISPVYLPYRSGMTTVAVSHATQLARLGHGVTVLCPWKQGLERREERDGVTIERIRPLFSYGNGAILPPLAKRLASFDIAHLHYPFYGTAEQAGTWKIPVVGTYHMDVFGQGLWRRFFSWHARKLLPRALEHMQRITVSSLDYARASRLGALMAENEQLERKVVELPLGVDTRRFSPMDREGGEDGNADGDGERTLLFVGALDAAHYFKNIPGLLRAFAVLAERNPTAQYRLIVAGKGSGLDGYRALAKKLKIADRVSFPGFVPDDELPALYRRADACILPSLDSSEAFGLVLVEAMACGTPVIASDIPGVRSVVDRGRTGWLIDDPEDTEEMASKIRMLLDDPKRCREFGKQARERVLAKYDEEKLGRKLEGIYEEVLAGSRVTKRDQ